MEEPSSALCDAFEVAIITTCVSSALLRLQISRWYFPIVWDTSLLDLLQFHFDGLLRSFFLRQFLQGILHDAMVASDGLVISPVPGALYLHSDTPLVHLGSFLTCDTSVFLRFLRSLYTYLGPDSSSARSSLSLYSFSLIQQFLSDLTIVPLSSEGVAVAISSLSLRVDSFDYRRSLFRSSDSFWSTLHQLQVTFVFDRGRFQVSFCSPGGCFFWFCSMLFLGGVKSSLQLLYLLLRQSTVLLVLRLQRRYGYGVFLRSLALHSLLRL